MEPTTEAEMPFKSPAFEHIWTEWLEYRKERRLPKYVPRGLKMTFTKLIRESDNNEQVAIRMIENSIEQNYQGIFKVKDNGSSKSTPTKSIPRGEAATVAAIEELDRRIELERRRKAGLEAHV